jgi:hypothetical protein
VIDPLTTNGTPGAALCSYGRLRAPNESRSVSIRPDGDVVAVRLMGTTQLWHPTTTPLRDDTMLRLVSDLVAAAPSIPSTVAPSSAGVALATSSAAAVGVPAASSGPSTAAMPSTGSLIPTATGASAPSRTGSSSSRGEDGEPVGASELSLALRATRLPHADVEDVVCAVCGKRTHFDARTLGGRTGHGACLVGLVGR